MIEAILFDFGNVVIDLKGYDPIKLVSEHYNSPVADSKVAFTKAIERFSAGLISEDEMWSEVKSDLMSEIDSIPNHILHDSFFESITKNEGLLKYALSLKDKFVIGVLSDTNPIHGDFLRENGYFEIFEPNVFLSNETGFRKPSTKAYLHALSVLKLEANQVIFIDDRLENVEAAKEMGFETILAVSEEQIITDLQSKLEN